MSNENYKQPETKVEKNIERIILSPSHQESEDVFVETKTKVDKELKKSEKSKLKNNNNITKQFTKTKKRKAVGKKSDVQLTKRERKILKEQELKEKELLRKQKMTWKRRIMNYCILTLCGIVTGAGLGTWYYKNVLSSNVDWETYLLELPTYQQKIIDTQNNAFAKILGTNFKEEEKENFVETAISKGITPADLSMAENYQLADYNFSNAEKYLIQSSGEVKTIASQTIYSEKLRDGNIYQSINISAGIMSIAEIAQLDSTTNNVVTVKGNDIKATSAVWNGAKTNYTASQFKETTGGLPNTSQNYIICEETITNNNEGQITVIENEDGSKYYQFEIELDIIYSVLNYIKQIKYTSSLSAYPEFYSIKQTITIDSNWNFVSIDCIENYSIVAFGMKNNCTGTLLNNFYFDRDVVAEIL